LFGLAALSDDAEAVVVKVSEAVGSALDEFHFSMEAFGNAVVAGEAPHACDLFAPVAEGLSQGFGQFEAAGGEGLDKAEQLGDERLALSFGLAASAEQRAEALLELIDGFERRLLAEDGGEPQALLEIEAVAARAQQV
jgi:hypothetical protein